MLYGIKFHPNKPASPHLNGKVERSQKTDKTEFYAAVNIKSNLLHELLAEWQQYYNWKAYFGFYEKSRLFYLYSWIKGTFKCRKFPFLFNYFCGQKNVLTCHRPGLASARGLWLS